MIDNKSEKEIILHHMKSLDNLYLKAHDYELFMVALCLWLRIDENLVKKINKRDLKYLKDTIFKADTLLNEEIVDFINDIEGCYKVGVNK